MNAPSQKNDGMGSLLYPDNTVRFRVWAPFASSVQVHLDRPNPGTSFALANEPGTPNWSADGIPASANTRYQYLITTAPGPDNDTSGPHLRTDARALQVEGSAASCQGYIVDPALFTTNRVPFTTPPFEDFLIYHLTDMGCTFRLFHREAMDLIRPSLTIGGSHFGPQLLMEVVAHEIPFVEIPVNYRPRVGKSSVTGSFWKAFVLGLQMIVLVLQYRVGLYARTRRMWTAQESSFVRPGAPDMNRELTALAKSVGSNSRRPVGEPREQPTAQARQRS